jgi:hypothetical protein
MIFRRPEPEEPIDQGDIIDGCPIATVLDLGASDSQVVEIQRASTQVYVLTQTCDLANDKARRPVVAVVRSVQELVTSGALKPAEIKGPIRATRVYGWYFLPKDRGLGLAEALVDLREIHTVELGTLSVLCRRGQRRARLLTPYREHLAQHFAITYSRIGLPQPYPTD